MTDLFIYLFIYLFIIREPTLATVGSTRVNVKEREVRRAKEKKWIETERAKAPTPAQAMERWRGSRREGKNTHRECAGRMEHEALFQGDGKK